LKKSPVAFGGGDPSKFIGIPMASQLINAQPHVHVLGHDSNPYHKEHGAWEEVMPPHDSHITEQFLTGFQKITDGYYKRHELLADPKWIEPNIRTGFSERAKHCQGIQISSDVTESSATTPTASALETPVTVTHPLTRKTVEGTMIKPGLRGGGDAMIPSYVMTTVDLDPKASSPTTKHEALKFGCRGYSYLDGILLKPEQDVFKQPPFVILPDGTMETIIAGQNLRRIANNTSKGANAVKVCGGYYGPVASAANWPTTPRYTCSCCGSCDHGLKHCPVDYIKGGKESCMHCGKDGHLLAACPYPQQNLANRTLIQSLILYISTIHCRISVLTWEFEHKVISEEKYLKLRAQMVKNPLQGEAMHAFATLPGCPACDCSHHEGSILSLIEACADRFRERGVEEWKLAPKEWMYDNRRCPLYTIIFNKHFKGFEFLAYNPNNSVALDAVYRDFLRAQGVSFTDMSQLFNAILTCL
jgi:hypothetical protein